MTVIGLIPARGGSKGIPRKNIADCAGKPLLAYTAKAALESKELTRTLLSTDDTEIKGVGLSLGLEVPFMRPAHFANDESPMISVLKHALTWLKQTGENVEAVALLQPTSPLRTGRHIDEAVKLFRDRNADTVVSVMRVPHQFNPTSLMDLSPMGNLKPHIETQILRRQDKPELFARNGPAILIVSPKMIESGNFYGGTTVGYVMDADSSLDIDEESDLKRAEFMLIQGRT